MSRAGSGAHTHTHTLASRRARLLRHTSVHAFILAGTTHCKYATVHMRVRTRRNSWVHTRWCKHTWFWRMLASALSPQPRRLGTHLHLGASPSRGWGKEWKNQAHAFPFGVFSLPFDSAFLTQVGTGRGVKDDWGRGERGGPPRAAALQSRGTCATSTPSFPGLAPPRLCARAPALALWGPNSAFLRLGARCLLLPSRSPHPRSEGQSALPP